MKLLGARFRNFACFEECFVPLHEAVQLLVGRNNAGKTALLRGLTALSSLGRTPADQQLKEYCWMQENPLFGLDVLFTADLNDKSVLDQLVLLPQVQSAADLTVEYKLSVNCSSGRADLMSASLLFGTAQIRLAENGQQLFYASNGGLANRSSITDGFLEPMRNLNTVLVAAHRVVRPWGLQQQNFLMSNAESLAAVLDELYGTDRDKFHYIESFVISVFPEFRFVNPTKQQGTTAVITLTRQKSDQKIPLSHCGTGVEQVLALATFIFTSKPGTLLLLDEPHSYLHPIAEKALISLILTYGKHRYVISTHSAILINAVTPDRILSLNSAKVAPETASAPSDVSQILHSLGYQNSDFLFNDRLVFVEGETEREVLPLLLSLSSRFDGADIEKTGFPVMEGHGKLSGRKKQTSLLHYEKLLAALGRSNMPRIYLFDGDCSGEDRRLIENTPLLKDKPSAVVKFLPRCEIENYLLDPSAIAAAISASARLDGDQVTPSADEIERMIENLLESRDEALFPSQTASLIPRRAVKGSIVLERIFSHFGLNYSKRKSGLLIASYISPERDVPLDEIWALVSELFPKVATNARP